MATIDTDEGWQEYLDVSEEVDPTPEVAGSFAARAALASAFVIGTWGVLRLLDIASGGAW